jgi:hypothetical protein
LYHKSVLYGAFVWARRALDRHFWQFRARAVDTTLLAPQKINLKPDF